MDILSAKVHLINNMRLDMYLCAYCGLFSREKAKEAIKLNRVRINGKIAHKSAIEVSPKDYVEVDGDDLLLGRAGYKLRDFLQDLSKKGLVNVDFLHDKRAIDVGSSTGGFTQVLLESGVCEVICVDVGDKQLHQQLRNDRRVCLYEHCDFRDFKPKGYFDICVCDVSFISLFTLLPYFETLNCHHFIWLFKPQFEVGKNVKRNKKGVLKHKDKALDVFETFCQYLVKKGFEVIHTAKSALKGKEGNEEYFIYAFR